MDSVFTKLMNKFSNTHGNTTRAAFEYLPQKTRRIVFSFFFCFVSLSPSSFFFTYPTTVIVLFSQSYSNYVHTKKYSVQRIFNFLYIYRERIHSIVCLFFISCLADFRIVLNGGWGPEKKRERKIIIENIAVRSVRILTDYYLRDLMVFLREFCSTVNPRVFESNASR